MKSKTLRFLNLMLYAVLALSPAFAAAASFTPTGSMTFARHGHTATLLANGMVLVAGGFGYGGLETAELYNPATGTFTLTGSMRTSRYGHTATLLANGMVLVAGGSSGVGDLETAELYNPATGTFTLTGSMRTSRYGHTATLLANGMVLVAGGQSGTGSLLATAELFNPTTGVFTSTGNMIAGRFGHTATLLKGGRVLLAGGTGDSGSALGDLFNPATATFSATATKGTQALWLAATLLADGRVLLAGGSLSAWFSCGSIRVVRSYSLDLGTLFEASNESFVTAGYMTAYRTAHTATRLGNGEVLIAGGATFLWECYSRPPHPPVLRTSLTRLASAELFNPTNATFTHTANMTTARSAHTATLLWNGKVLVVGGTDAKGNPLSSAELYF